MIELFNKNLFGAGYGMYGMEDDFSIFHISNFLPFQTKIFFHNLFHSILPYQRTIRLEAMQRIFCTFAMM